MNPTISASAGSIVSSNPELGSLFEEYLNDARSKLLKKLNTQEEDCSANHDNPDNYAKCMYSFHKGMKEDILGMTFRTTFLKKKMEECMQSVIYKRNREEGTKHCIRVTKELIDKLLKAV